MQIIPDPLSEEAAAAITRNFRAWVIGNALRELDQFLSLALDDAWDFVKAVRLFGGDLRGWKRIDRITNVAEKYKKVMKEMGRFGTPQTECHQCLVTLSEARNCLSHDLGLVTAKRATEGSMLTRWLAMQMQIVDAGVTTVIDESSLPFSVEEGATIQLAFGIKEVKSELGSSLQLTAADLLEICLFYKIIIDRICTEIREYAELAGIKFPGEGEPPVTMEKRAGETWVEKPVPSKEVAQSA